MTKFEELGIKDSILKGLTKIGFEEPFPIQEAAIPSLMQGRDVVGQAHTGSGKTAAFGVPMLQNIEPGGGLQGLILAPTRELASQITNEFVKFGEFTNIRTVTIYGGQGMGIQLDALKKNPEIVVATPGRLIDHLNRESIRLDDITHMVLDEADTMLDMGFIDDVRFILNHLPEKKTMSLFSATMPVDILRLAEEYLVDAKQFLLDADDLSGEGIAQSYLVIRDREKPKHLTDFIEQNEGHQCIVFCSTKYRTRDVAHMLKSQFSTVVIEGDMSQNLREKSMSKFRQAKAQVLVATDVAARGIDVPRVSLVINYDVPNQDVTYFHRIGRTARAGARGRAITLVSYSSLNDFNLIKRQIKTDLVDLNKEMGIEISIPDPLKRDVTTRRHGTPSGPRYGGSHGRPGDRNRSGGGRFGGDRGRFGGGRPGGDRNRSGGGRFGGDRGRFGGGRPGGDRNRSGGGRFGGDRPGGGRFGGDRPGGGRFGGDRPGGGRFGGDRPGGDDRFGRNNDTQSRDGNTGFSRRQHGRGGSDSSRSRFGSDRRRSYDSIGSR